MLDIKLDEDSCGFVTRFNAIPQSTSGAVESGVFLMVFTDRSKTKSSFGLESDEEGRLLDELLPALEG